MSISILYISNEKWQEFENNDRKDLKIKHLNYNELEHFEIYIEKEIKTKREDGTIKYKKQKRLKKFNAIVIENLNSVTDLGLDKLLKISSPYCVLYNCKQELDKRFDYFIKKIIPFKEQLNDKNELLDNINKCFFSSQYGDRVLINDYFINKAFKGNIEYLGGSYIKLTGFFGEDFKQIASWTGNKVAYKNSAIELWPEYIKSDGVEIYYRITSVLEGSLDNIVSDYIFTEEDLKSKLIIDDPYNTYFNISIYAKGQGELNLGITHYRFSRKQYGEMTLGAEALTDSQTREQLLFFFDPGDLKPPLNIYFSGFRTAEGFEGYGMIKKLGSPFILVTDPRLEGGAFYFGSDELENKLLDKIKEKMNYLNFSNNDLIFSGLSMGTFGAMYYGCRLSAHAIIMGLPLASIGNIAKNIKLIAPNVFKTSLDVVRHHIGELSLDAADKLNARFWDIFKNSNIDNTTIIASYMKDDDYDRTAYYDIIEALKDKKTRIIGRGLEGRHMDASFYINQWFINQYKELIVKDFGRNYDE